MGRVVVPAEHGPHAGCWMALPHLAEEWPDLAAAQQETLALAAAIAETEPVTLLVPPGTSVPELPPGVNATPAFYGDAWTRDTAPLLGREGERPVAVCFRFDGWGGRYLMAGDDELAPWLAGTLGVPVRRSTLVGEGGGLELDGEGTLLLTRDSWVDSPRANPEAREIESELRELLGVDAFIWLEGTLRNDHTDGHVDTLARFVRPGEVVVMAPEAGDPNAEMLAGLAEQLEGASDARGRRLRVHRIPGPGPVLDAEGALLPASYVNYYLAEDQVLVPSYGVAADEPAREALEALFPERRVRSVAARAILQGGGALHCVTHEIPAFARRRTTP
ncbi:MAG: agmatine deiminase family protein [Myxococcota bacterium]